MGFSTETPSGAAESDPVFASCALLRRISSSICASVVFAFKARRDFVFSAFWLESVVNSVWRAWYSSWRVARMASAGSA